jgi:hypothetical protein
MATPDVSAGIFVATMQDGSQQAVQVPHFVITSVEIMTRWEAELSGMIVKKQKQWKGKLCDERNQRCVVRFNGVFQSRMSAEEISKWRDYDLPSDGWASVISDAQYRKTLDGTDDAYVLKALGLGSEVEMIHYTCMKTSRVDQVINPEGCFNQDALHRLQDEAHTGNHRRTHAMRVPTAAGEPVRA